MSTLRKVPAEVRRELQRLDDCAHRASQANDFATEATCRLRWAELYRATQADDSPLPAVRLTPLQRDKHRIYDHTPEWRIRQKLAPVVAIVRVEKVEFKNARGHRDVIWREHLACGHHHDYFETADYPARSQRRRCKTCGSLAMVAAGYSPSTRLNQTTPDFELTASRTRPLALPDAASFSFLARPVVVEKSSPQLVTMPKPAARAMRRESKRRIASSATR